MTSLEGVICLALGAVGIVMAVCILCYCAMHANVRLKIIASVSRLISLHVEVEPRGGDSQVPGPPEGLAAELVSHGYLVASRTASSR